MKQLGLLLVAVLFTGCAYNARLYPVEGAYSKITPPVIIDAKFTGARASGEIEFTLPDGPTCKGEWASVSSTSIGTAFGGASMLAIGAGGQSPAAAVVRCSDGRTVEIEFTTNTIGAKSGVGSAKDTAGNRYRFML